MCTDRYFQWLGRVLLVAFSTTLVCSLLRAQFRTPAVSSGQPLTGSLTQDLRMDESFTSLGPQQKKAQPARLSPLRAMLYSAVVPGAGQAYAKSYWQAAGFFLVEVVGWVYYARNYTFGNQREQQFKDYADGGWSVVQYVDWMRTYYGSAVPGLMTDPIYTGTSAQRPWDRVNWQLLNEYETKIAALGVNGFTHTLPQRPNQQYYEEIGKYPQFGGGWDDAASFTPADVLTMNVSAHFLHYRDLRGLANQFYDNATGASYVLVANHVLSAVEAAWNATHKNHQIGLRSSLEPIDRGLGWVELVPTTSLRVDF